MIDYTCISLRIIIATLSLSEQCNRIYISRTQFLQDKNTCTVEVVEITLGIQLVRSFNLVQHTIYTEVILMYFLL